MDIYFHIAIGLLFLSIMLSGLEYIRIQALFQSNNLLGWKMLKFRNRLFTQPELKNLFQQIYCVKIKLSFWAMIILPISGLLSLFFYNNAIVSSIFIFQVIILNSTLLLYNYRNRYGLDGADQFNTIAITALSLCLIFQQKEFYKYFLPFLPECPFLA